MAGFHRLGRRLARSAQSAWLRFSSVALFWGVPAMSSVIPHFSVTFWRSARVALGQIDEAEASVYHALKDPDQLTELESPANVGSWIRGELR
jgi:hypothetical protein